MGMDVATAVMGWVLVVGLPLLKWWYRAWRAMAHAADMVVHAEFMVWMEHLRQAGVEQAADLETLVMLRRYARLVPAKSKS